MVETKVRLKDDPSEGCDWSIRRSIQRMIRPKDVIGRYEDLILEIVQKDAPKAFDWLRRSNCPYDNVSALSSFQTDLIGREGNLVFSSWTRLIGLSNGLVLIRTLLIGRSADQLPASSLGFLATRCQTCKRADEKTITRKRLLWATNTPF